MKDCCVKSIEVRVRASREDGDRVKHKMNVCKQKGKSQPAGGGKGSGEKRGEELSICRVGGGLLDTGANEVIMTRGDTEFTTVLCNELLLYQSIWQLRFKLNV